MPCPEGGTPVITETLFGLVKLGIAPSATDANPSCMNFRKFGRSPRAIAAFTYDGSPPSISTTTTGRVGQL